MAYRKATSKVKDARIFRNTAMKTKKINIKPHVSRGGIML